MIYSITGTIIEKNLTDVVIECNGMGYFVNVPTTDSGALPPVGQTATLYTMMNVSENDVSLFGFSNKASRDMFRMITTVSGVGPKVGVAILSALSPEKIVLAIGAGDFKALTAASGVGPKLAQRMVLELKDKVAKDIGTAGMNFTPQNIAGAAPVGAAQQAMAALVSLGYSGSEAAAALSKVDGTLEVSEMIRLALQKMGSGR